MFDLTTFVSGAVGLYLLQRLSGVPRDVQQHDRLIGYRSDDLDSFLEDENRKLEQYMRRLDRRTAGGVLPTNQFDDLVEAIEGAVTSAVERYRNERRKAERDSDQVSDQEGVLHSAYRRLRQRPKAKLRYPTREVEILQGWIEGNERYFVRSDKVKRAGGIVAELLEDRRN